MLPHVATDDCEFWWQNVEKKKKRSEKQTSVSWGGSLLLAMRCSTRRFLRHRSRDVQRGLRAVLHQRAWLLTALNAPRTFASGSDESARGVCTGHPLYVWCPCNAASDPSIRQPALASSYVHALVQRSSQQFIVDQLQLSFTHPFRYLWWTIAQDLIRGTLEKKGRICRP